MLIISQQQVCLHNGATFIIMSIISWQHLFEELKILIKAGNLETPEQKENIQKLLERYQSNEEDFKQYLHFHEKGYTKNLVEDFGSICNVIVMCWAPKQKSAYHGHEGSRCFVKVLKGELVEQQVPFPCGERRDGVRVSHLGLNQTSYIDDNIGLHKVFNNSIYNPAVTLHIYMPAYTKCRIFSDEKTAENSETLDVTFHSKFGQQ